MILDKASFEEFLYVFMISNTSKYFYDRAVESDAVNIAARTFSKAQLLAELDADSALGPLDSLVYAYFLLFTLYKMQVSEYASVAEKMVAAGLPRASEVFDIMKAYAVSNSFSTVKYTPTTKQQ